MCVIGPGSYNVAASDLHPVVDGNKLVKFADDLTLIIPARNVDKRSTEFQHVQSWSSANNLQLNCKKSQETFFRRPRNRQIQDIPELPNVPRVSSIKLFGVTLAENVSIEEHIMCTDINSSSSMALYALRILRSHGTNDADLQTVSKSTALSKLLYASPSWWGFTNANQRERLEGYLRRAVKACFHPDDSPSFSELCTAADDALVHRIVSDVHYPLHYFLPPKLPMVYNMRSREHEYQLPEKNNSIHEKSIFYKA